MLEKNTRRDFLWPFLHNDRRLYAACASARLTIRHKNFCGYPRAADGTIDKFNDLPAQYKVNVNRIEVPCNRQPGMRPAFSAADIVDVIAFPGTLTDGYVAPN